MILTARKQIDVFGVDELEKAFKRMSKRFPDEGDALLMARGQAVNKRTKELTPVKSGKLKKSWRLKKVKPYKGGTVRVVRIQSTAPHAHLIERGHRIVRGGKTRERGRQLNKVELAVRGITTHGRARAFKMLETAMREQESRLTRDAEKMLKEICRDAEL